MKAQFKNCQNCKKDFTIEPEDFNFYEKIKVPPPTFCPECRLQRRLSLRNERILYRRNCDLCNESTLTTFNSNYQIYCHSCWWSDKWDPKDYAQDYDFSKSFFEQYKYFISKVPLCGLFNINQVNSEYCNYTYESKNCYLNFASDMNEDTGYLYHSIENKNCYDILGSRKNENCYELIDCEGCYGSNHLTFSDGCIDSMYCYDCNNCSNCIGCFGLRNAKYYIFNERYTPEKYKEEIKKLNLNKKTGIEILKNKFNELLIKYPRKFINSKHINNCTGDYLKNAKNCKTCFDIEGPAKDLKYSIYGVTKMENIYDAYAFGVNVEDCYEVLGAGDNVQNVMFSCYTFIGSFNCAYSCFSNSSSNLFGCISIKNGQYCIFNKQYTKEEYEKLVRRIVKHMNDMPYVDKKGRTYKYGEFFPSELSPFCYNETIAQEYFPLTKEQALEQGYKWKDREERNYQIDIYNKDISDNINDVNDDIINKVIECAHKGTYNEQCTEAFKIIKPEFQFYKRMNLPLPRLCPNCRHYNRLKQRNPFKLWHRKCMNKGCNNEFETSYAPDRPEIIYCESCYNKEVY
jgi:hypothetical protein